jgi:hypothetical protein
MTIDRYTKAALAALGLALFALVRERAYRRGLEAGYQQARLVRWGAARTPGDWGNHP